MQCRFCRRDKRHPCRNTREMDPRDDINTDKVCHATLNALGGGERGMVPEQSKPPLRT